jgi:hypothetical protein
LNPHPGEGSPGGSGIILHYTVTGGVGTWAIFPSPPTPPLNSVFMVSATEGWAVGDGTEFMSAVVLHYTVTGGLGTWNTVTIAGLSTGTNLNSVFMLNATSGWAVGGLPQGSCPAWTDIGGECPPTFFAAGPIIIHWDGTKWSQVATPELAGGGNPVLLSAYFTGPNDGWAVGTPGILVPTILHWDGVRWMPITLSPALLGVAPPTIPPTLKSVYMEDQMTGWIVGTPVDFTETTIPATKPLASIFRFAPFGGVFGATSTVTVVSTLSSSTTALTSLTATTISTVTSGAAPTTIKVVDYQGNPIQGVNVTIASLGLQGVTNSQGIVIFNLPPGTYVVTLTKGTYSGAPSINVTVPGQTFTLTLVQPGFGGIPGFPVESIIAGFAAGLLALGLIGHRRKRTPSKQ